MPVYYQISTEYLSRAKRRPGLFHLCRWRFGGRQNRNIPIRRSVRFRPRPTFLNDCQLLPGVEHCPIFGVRLHPRRKDFFRRLTFFLRSSVYYFFNRLFAFHTAHRSSGRVRDATAKGRRVRSRTPRRRNGLRPRDRHRRELPCRRPTRHPASRQDPYPPGKVG